MEKSKLKEKQSKLLKKYNLSKSKKNKKILYKQIVDIEREIENE